MKAHCGHGASFHNFVIGNDNPSVEYIFAIHSETAQFNKFDRSSNTIHCIMTDHSHHNLIGNKLDRRISFTTTNKSDWILLEFC